MLFVDLVMYATGGQFAEKDVAGWHHIKSAGLVHNHACALKPVHDAARSAPNYSLGFRESRQSRDARDATLPAGRGELRAGLNILPAGCCKIEIEVDSLLPDAQRRIFRTAIKGVKIQPYRPPPKMAGEIII